MKLTTTTMVTVDGVMQGLGGADEDRSGGFERGGWVAPLFDYEAGTFLNQVYERADAFLFGRRTYDLFASFWGAEELARAAAEDPGNNQIAAALNSGPKYLASTTITEPSWANTTLLTGDLASAIDGRRLRVLVQLFLVPVGVLEYDDRVVDHDPDGQDQAEQGQRVDGVA